MLKTFSITDIGRKRKVNQDYIYTSEKPVGNLPNVFIVADGMGGHNAGDYASKVTVETMLAEMENSFEKNPTLIFRKAIEEANDVIPARMKSWKEWGLRSWWHPAWADSYRWPMLETADSMWWAARSARSQEIIRM